jgi:hypothetical protein
VAADAEQNLLAVIHWLAPAQLNASKQAACLGVSKEEGSQDQALHGLQGRNKAQRFKHRVRRRSQARLLAPCSAAPPTMSLMRMLRLGPEVSFSGSPTVSPITAA